MTLKQLLWAADGRQRAEWRRTASLAARVHLSMGGEAIDPEELMPERYRERARPVPKTERQLDHENRAAWVLLDSAFNPGRK